ncbi:MAG TPA: carboxypeptidase-like regulatory domain-containing protein, partial [Chitinophagaceae bacterium]|nr:carboxypeptidase-like regulatory domain-containing protein [Chitinophagaceae bacterium]
YYNGITDRPKYAFSIFPGFTQIAIRLKDKYIEFDSIYLQPYYKHDIVLNIDKKSAYYKVRDTVNYWTYEEKDLLNRRILRMENNNRNNGGYVWQDDKAYYLGSAGDHIAGPFSNYDSIQFYKPGDFDFKFSFEPGYRYRVTPQMVRLEKIPLFSFKDEVKLAAKKSAWILGDTLVDLPVIKYEKKKGAAPFLEQSGYNYYGNRLTTSVIQLQAPTDSSVAYTILANDAGETDYRVLWGMQNILNNINKGSYTVVLVTNHFKYLTAANIIVDTQGTYCVKFDKPIYGTSNDIVERIIKYQEAARLARDQERLKIYRENTWLDSIKSRPSMILQSGNSGVYGRITDTKGGDPIPFAVVSVKGYKTGVAASADGSFSLRNIPGGKYVLLFSAVGYEAAEKNITVSDGENVMMNVSLQMSSSSMSEVVVTAFGVKRQAKELGYSISTVKGADLTNALMGKVAGLNIQAVNNGIFGDTRLTLRGIRSLTGDNQPLLVIDGVITPLDKLASINPDDISDVTTLKDAAATALYGSAAANGVIILTTKGFNPKMMRDVFRDYAFWQPNLITDENGEAKFAVTYPDNITSWQTWVVGMDKKHRITKASKTVRSFKPLLAQLSAPQFLVEGDTAVAVGKKNNYTTTDLNVEVDYTLNGKRQIESSEKLKGNDATISQLGMIVPSGADTMTARFSIKASNGFADGEQRKLPVLKRGTTETVGEFFILEGDTSVSIRAKENAGGMKLFAQNNTFDLLLEEIDHLNNYPYYCMEQTASKLTGLLMEKKIRETLKQSFKNEKQAQQLIDKLRKGQLFEGGWSWWEGGTGNLAITNYVTRALLQMRGDALTETNIRNALLYLFNRLPKMDRYDLPETIYTLSEAGHDMDYEIWLKQFKFDSLQLHQQWQMVAVMQKQKLPYEKELQKLMDKKVSTMLGGLHWGENSYWWNRNAMATTVLAYKTLGRIPGYEAEQKKIIQYFLEQRRNGYWQNTVESASILSAILPDVMMENQNFNEKATLQISGDTSMLVTAFPFALKLSDGVDNISIAKHGGGQVYFTAYQQIFNKDPQVVDSNFRISSYFDNARTVITTLKAGEKVSMKVEVQALKDADYVQIEIPVPAGCTFASKKTEYWNEHREYFRDKVLMFVEKMPKGTYTYEVELEPRYTGTYTINPAKAELMYYPVFYGRNGVEKIRIE